MSEPVESAQNFVDAVDQEALFDALVHQLRFDDRGLIPVVTQDARTGEVLMMAWADAEAVARTITRREGTYWSRSRGELWVKGATSGHVQKVRKVLVDCDADTVLYLVEQSGAACHTGNRTCFFRELTADGIRNDEES